MVFGFVSLPRFLLGKGGGTVDVLARADSEGCTSGGSSGVVDDFGRGFSETAFGSSASSSFPLPLRLHCASERADHLIRRVTAYFGQGRQVFLYARQAVMEIDGVQGVGSTARSIV